MKTDQPKPTTCKWTWENHTDRVVIRFGGKLVTELGPWAVVAAKEICSTGNAALAAEGAQGEWTVERLREYLGGYSSYDLQLRAISKLISAEREKTKQHDEDRAYAEKAATEFATQIQQLSKQLAAAQAAIKKHNDSPVLYEIPYTDTTALDAAISAAVEKARSQWRTHKDMQREIAAAQQPLVTLLERAQNFIGRESSLGQDIDAKLAKVKEGK